MDAILAALEALAEQKSPQGGQPAPLAAFMRPAAPPRPPTPAVQPPVAPAAVQAPAPAHAAPPNPQGHPLQGMFADGNSLLRAIIAAEVLGPPVAFKEHTPWNQQPNEPST